jgi:hypothetical protein
MRGLINGGAGSEVVFERNQMRKVSAVTLLALMCLLTGCTEYWYQADKTFEECRQDRRECFNELNKFSSLQEFGDYEFKFLENCMGLRGYAVVKEDQLPLRVKRQEPSSSLHWRLKGIAGRIEED